MDISKIYTPATAGIIVGLVIGFVAGWYWTEGKNENSSQNAFINENGGVIAEVDDSNRTQDAKEELISVDDQSAGSEVIVREVTLNETGWVAVREMINGEMGNILGATRIKEAGTSTDVSVKVLRPTVSGQDYAIVIYRDDGDEDFDFNFDSLVVSGSEPVSATFQVN